MVDPRRPQRFWFEPLSCHSLFLSFFLFYFLIFSPLYLSSLFVLYSRYRHRLLQDAYAEGNVFMYPSTTASFEEDGFVLINCSLFYYRASSVPNHNRLSKSTSNKF